MKRKRNIIVGLSGGVDSAVAALLLQQQGHHVEGLFMKNWEEDDEPGYCAAAEDLEEAKAVSKLLGITLHTVSFSTEYWDRVFSCFLEEYQAGRTPNPDVLCNKEIKFRAFLDHAVDLNADYIATGHYARISDTGEKLALLSGLDENKDQSYFLYLLGQEQLARSLFPIGHLEKTEVRRLAAEAGLPNHDRKDSTGICFIGERRFRDFLSRYLAVKPGEIRNQENEVIGTHQGAALYTLGQRQGLGIGGAVEGTGEPWYVTAKDITKNILWAAQGTDHPALFHNCITAGQLHWISGIAPQFPLHCSARVRYRQTSQECTINMLNKEQAIIRFTNSQRAVTPGQAVVIYSNDTCLGGGTIEHAENDSTFAISASGQ